MNNSVYIFGHFNNEYAQYPDDYTSEIFKKFYDNTKSPSQISIFRKDEIVYYGYIVKLAKEPQYIGICILVNGIYITDIDFLFNLFENTISKMVFDDKIIGIDNNGKVIAKIDKLHEVTAEVSKIQENVFQGINNIAFSKTRKLPPVNYSIENNRCKHGNEFDINISESICKYNNIFIRRKTDIYSLSSMAAAKKIAELETKISSTSTEKKIVEKKNNSTKSILFQCALFLAFIIIIIIYANSNKTRNYSSNDTTTITNNRYSKSTETKPKNAAPKSYKYKTRTIRDCNLWEAPTAAAIDVVCACTKNTDVYVLDFSENNTYYHVYANGYEGYMAKSWLQDKNSNEANCHNSDDETTETKPQNAAPNVYKYKTTTTDNCKLWETPTSSNIVYICPKDTDIYVLGFSENDSYYHVYANGYEGYIAKSWLKNQNSDESNEYSSNDEPTKDSYNRPTETKPQNAAPNTYKYKTKTANSCNLWKTPESNNLIVVYKCPKDADVYVLDIGKNDYYHVYVNGYDGYIRKSLLQYQNSDETNNHSSNEPKNNNYNKPTETKAQNVVNTYKYKTKTIDNCDLWEKPASQKVVYRCPIRADVLVLDFNENDAYYHVSVNGYDGYIAKFWLQEKNSNEKNDYNSNKPTETKPKNVVPSTYKYKTKTIDDCSLWATPTSSKVVCICPKDADVYILDFMKKDKYYHVLVNGYEGYIAKSYLQNQSSNETNSYSSNDKPKDYKYGVQLTEKAKMMKTIYSPNVIYKCPKGTMVYVLDTNDQYYARCWAKDSNGKEYIGYIKKSVLKMKNDESSELNTINGYPYKYIAKNTDANCPMYSTPIYSSTQICNCPKGATVYVLDDEIDDVFYKVYKKSHGVGYISKIHLEKK